MASKLSKRADGRYQASFRYNGRQYNCCGKTQKEAKQKAADKLKELESQRENHDNPYMDDYYKHFTEMRQGKVRESTLRAQAIEYRSCSAVIIYGNVKFGSLKIADVKPADIVKVQKALTDSGKTARTVNDTMAHLKHVFSKAMKEYVIEKDPCLILEPVQDKRIPCRETKHRALTQEEREKFFKAAEDRHSYFLPLFRFLINTGVRIGEAAALTADDIDKEGIHIHATVTRNTDGAYIVNETTKTDSGRRLIPCNFAILGAVKEQKELQFAVHGSNRKHPQLFTSPQGDILREYTANREIKRICEAAGIDLFTCHAFRATFATEFLAQRPQDYKSLSTILGHSDVKITLNLYCHSLEPTKKAAMEAISIAM